MRSIVIFSTCLLTACVGYQAIRPPYSVALVGSDGRSRGAVEIFETRSGTRITVRAQELPLGEHGLHLHAVGRCDTPDFASAGGHWNPLGRQHGHLNPQGAHLGDLPNLTVSANGRGAIDYLLSEYSLADGDGTSLVIHARPDDFRTDPIGNSGGRIACAVLAGPRT